MIINILIVDDKESNLYSLEALLQEINIEDDGFSSLNIIKASNGADALEILISLKVDLIILDIQMPNMNGFEVAKYIKMNRYTKDIPIIFLTAFFKKDDFLQQGYDMGAVDYFTKPINEKEFRNRIKLYINICIKTNTLNYLNTTLTKQIEKEVMQNKQKEQHILSQSKLAQMGEMISMIAHQWRQPLTAISSTANNLSFKLMLDEYDKEEFAKEITLISEYSQHLSKTIDDFRSFFKSDKQKEKVNITNIINSTLDIVGTSIKNKNITIVTNLSYQEAVYTFPNEIKQVVLNFLKNAEDNFIEKNIANPIITIETYCNENKEFVLSVKDNGEGIPEEIIDKIFDPYFSTKKAKDGTGLGLYMSKLIIEEHCKGKLTVQNDSEGIVFSITFPNDKE